MKKVLSLVLVVCMLIGILPTTMAGAASAPVVLFDYDFEDCVLGENVRTKADTLEHWSSGMFGDLPRVEAVQDGEHGIVAKYYRKEANGLPSVNKVLYAGDLTNLTVSFEAKNAGAALQFALISADGVTQVIHSVSQTTWTPVKVTFNLSTGKYQIDGGSEKTMTGTDFTTLTLRFRAGVDATKNTVAYLDDVLVTTTDNVNPEQISNGDVGLRTPEEIMAPFAAYPAAPANAVPEGKYKLFAYDGSLNTNNGISTGTDALWTSVSRTKAAVVAGDDAVRFTNDKLSTQKAYLAKKFAVGTNPGTMTMEYYTVLAESGAYISLSYPKKNADGTTTTTYLVDTSSNIITKSTADIVADAWNHIKAEFDFVNKQYKVYINGALYNEGAFATDIQEGNYEVTVATHAKLPGAETMLVDNFVMYQDNVPVVEGEKYYGTTGTTWSMVTAGVELNDSSYVRNLRSHPRLLITDRQALLDRIATDPKVASWYASSKKTADSDLTKPVQPYEFSNGRNIKSEASVISGRITRAALSYLVEGDEQYFERGLAEIRNAGTFPDWSNTAPILASGIMYSIACFYDWCYYSPNMTAELKKEIVDIVKNKALWQFARSYDGVINAEIADGHTNRTTVANACGAGMAIAMADEEPALAQYLIDNAIAHIEQTINAYSTDGAFSEGTSYWNYANENMFNFLAQMDSATEEGYVKPAQLQSYYEAEELINTPDYWAYMSGPAGNFDYGDSSAAFSAAPLIYWYSQRYDKPFYSWFLERTLQRKGSSVSNKDFALAYYDKAYDDYNDGSMPLDKTFNATDLAQVASMRSSWTAGDALYAAIQGGDNRASHMARSLGTFVLDVNGKRFVRQLGHADYGSIYDPHMYYLSRGEGNNTIIANPVLDGTAFDQKKEAIARFIAHEEAENEAFTVLDLTETNDAFTDAKRGMYMTKGRNTVVLQDEIKTNTPSEIWWFAHTDADITLTEGGKGAIMRIGNEKVYAKITNGPADAVFTVMQAESMVPAEFRAPDEVLVDCQKLAIHMQNVSDTTLTVEFVPLRTGEGLPTAFTEVKPIADWHVSDNTISVKRQAGDAVVMLAGSPMTIAYESKKVINEKDSEVVPFVRDGVYYVPAIRTAQLAYAKASVVEKKDEATSTNYKVFEVTRDYATAELAYEELLDVDGTLYLPAQTLATALGMQVSVDESGMIVFYDRAPAYTEAQKNAIYTELNSCVYINGELFTGFSTDKTNYSIPNDVSMPSVRVTGGVQVNKTKEDATFVLNGTTYTFTRTDVNSAVSRYNVAEGKVMTSQETLGDSSIVDYMTDGDLSSRGAVKRTNVKKVSFNLELEAPHYIECFNLYDYRPDIASVAEKVVYKGRLEDGTWVELATIENLDANWTSGARRFNVAACTETRPITAIELYLEDTDGSVDGKEDTDRIYIYEFEVIGVKKSAAPIVPETYTTYEKKDGAYVFHTDIVAPPQSGYLLVSAYKGDAQVGMKIVQCTGKGEETYTLECAEFDTVRLVLLESFFTMRILSKPEIL